MQYSNRPRNLFKAWASSGNRNTIPVNSQVGVTAGAASWMDGFPPLTMTPIAAGGIPPSGLDMNGVLYAVSEQSLWASSGAGVKFDSDWASNQNIGGYAKGALVLRSDGTGYWISTKDNNTTNPETAPNADWAPAEQFGIATVSVAGANVTLTPAQYGKKVIRVSGTKSANVSVILPTGTSGEWSFINGTGGNFTLTARTAVNGGAAATLLPNGATVVVSDGTHCYAVSTTPQQAGGTVVVANPGGSGPVLGTDKIAGTTYSLSQPVTYTAGTGISISGNTISCTVTGGGTYTAGTGIAISNGVISSTVNPQNINNYLANSIKINEIGATNTPGANGWLTSVTINGSTANASVVQANPGNPTAVLSSVFINGTTYSVSSGSTGTGYITGMGTVSINGTTYATSLTASTGVTAYITPNVKPTVSSGGASFQMRCIIVNVTSGMANGTVLATLPEWSRIYSVYTTASAANGVSIYYGGATFTSTTTTDTSTGLRTMTRQSGTNLGTAPNGNQVMISGAVTASGTNQVYIFYIQAE